LALVVSRARGLDRRIAGFQPESWPQGQTTKRTPFSHFVRVFFAGREPDWASPNSRPTMGY